MKKFFLSALAVAVLAAGCGASVEDGRRNVLGAVPGGRILSEPDGKVYSSTAYYVCSAKGDVFRVTPFVNPFGQVIDVTTEQVPGVACQSVVDDLNHELAVLREALYRIKEASARGDHEHIDLVLRNIHDHEGMKR